MRRLREMNKVEQVSFYWLGVSGTALIVVVVLMIAGWFQLGGSWTEDHIELSFRLNTTEISEDVNEAAVGAATIAELETVRGVVAQIDPKSRSFQLDTDDEGDEMMSFDIKKSTRVFAGDESAELEQIAQGDKVVVVYRNDEETGVSVEKVTKISSDEEQQQE